MALVWIWIMIWSTAPEAAATFAPEYKDTGRDTRKALMSSALFILFVNTMVPLALTGGVGAKTVEAFDYVGALNDLVGPNLTNFFVVVICASFIISMNTATADGSRALYGISKDGLTVKQLGRLNRWNVPGNAMSLDMVINILFVLFVGNLFGILVASNIGYVFANICAISAFILLRKGSGRTGRGRSSSPRTGCPSPTFLTAAFIVFEVVGVGWFQIAGAGGVYGGTKEKIIGFGVLVDLSAPVPLPADRAGQGDAALARGDADDAGRARRDAPRGGDEPGVARGGIESPRGRLAAPLRVGQNPLDGRFEPHRRSSRSPSASAISAPEAFGASFDVAPSSEALELGAGLDGDPALAFRRTLGMFATGVTVLTTRVGEQVHGMTANAFMSVSLRPPLVLVSIDRRARMGALLHEGTRFGVNVLEAGQAGSPTSSPAAPATSSPEARFELVHETPLVEGALAHLVARVVRSYWGGDHSLFLGQVEFARYGEGRPLLFHGGRYERLIDDPRVFSLLPRELLDPILALGEEREYADGDAIMQIGESRARSSCSCSKGRCGSSARGARSRSAPGS